VSPGQKEVVTAEHNACIRELLQEIDVHGKADRHMKLLKLERESSLGIPLWIWPQTRICPIQFFQIIKKSFLSVSIILKPLVKMETFWKPKKNPGPLVPKLVTVQLFTDRVAFEPILTTVFTILQRNSRVFIERNSRSHYLSPTLCTPIWSFLTDD
jgi:hypothetical protein